MFAPNVVIISISSITWKMKSYQSARIVAAWKCSVFGKFLSFTCMGMGFTGLIIRLRMSGAKMLDFKVSLCERNEVRDFIEKWHYSHNINGLKCSYCFKLENGVNLIGAMIYGGLAMHNQFRKYVDCEDDIIELRRLVCVDDTPKNTESFFIGKTLKWLEKNTTIKKVLSYADSTHNHTGLIYQASNFKAIGKTAPGKMILHQGKLYHDKVIRTKYNGKLKPFAQRIRDALLSGEATYVPTLGKYIYLYDLRKRPMNYTNRVVDTVSTKT